MEVEKKVRSIIIDAKIGKLVQNRCVENRALEIWAKERADQPFMNPDEFSEALEELLGDENICCDENKL